MTFSDIIPANIRTDFPQTTKPSEPDFELKNPIDQDIFVNQITIVPTEAQFELFSHVIIEINDIVVFENKTAENFFSFYELFNVPITQNKLERGNSIKVYVISTITNYSPLTAQMMFHISEVNAPITSASKPKDRSTISKIESVISNGANGNATLGNINTNTASMIAQITALDTNGDGIISELEAANAKTEEVKTALALLDTDSNGIISKIELQNAQQVLTTAAVSALQSKLDAIKTNIDSMIGEIQALDTNGDGIISKIEQTRVQNEEVKTALALLDTDSNGIISKIELGNAESVLIKNAVNALDLDGDGIISAVELGTLQTTEVKNAVNAIDPVFWTEATDEGLKNSADGGSGIVATVYTCPVGKIAIVKVFQTRVKVQGSATEVRLLIRGQRIKVWKIDTGNPNDYPTTSTTGGFRQVGFSVNARKIWSDGSYPEFNLAYNDLQGETLVAGETIAYDGNFAGNFNATIDYAYTIYERDA